MRKRVVPLLVGAWLAIAILFIAFVALIVALFASAGGAIEASRQAEMAERPKLTAKAEAAVQPAEITQEPTKQPEPVQVQLQSEPAPTAPLTIPKSDLMAQAGIAEADFPIAAALMLNGDQWKPTGYSYGVWYANQGDTELEKFQRVHRYVVVQYGSWTAAQTWAAGNGGYW